ncbi:MAG: hypothetical protein ACEQSD_01320 [Flavobacteriales bacterium]
MSGKKVAFTAKPSANPATTANPDTWVEHRQLVEAPAPSIDNMKRLTIDIPVWMHQRLKSDCALRGVKMADEIRDILEKRYAQS